MVHAREYMALRGGGATLEHRERVRPATKGAVEGKLQRSLLSAIQRMTETLGRAEGSARRGNLNEAMVFLAALEKDAGGVRRHWPTL